MAAFPVAERFVESSNPAEVFLETVEQKMDLPAPVAAETAALASAPEFARVEAFAAAAGEELGVEAARLVGRTVAKQPGAFANRFVQIMQNHRIGNHLEGEQADLLVRTVMEKASDVLHKEFGFPREAAPDVLKVAVRSLVRSAQVKSPYLRTVKDRAYERNMSMGEVLEADKKGMLEALRDYQAGKLM